MSVFCFSMQLPTSLPSEYTKAAALDMSNHYYSGEPGKYSSPPAGDSIPPYSGTLNPNDNAGIMAQAQAAGMFPRFPLYDIPKPGYEPENLSTTEAFMRSYSTSSSGSCPNPYSPQERIHPSVHQQGGRGGIPPGAYPSPQSVMSNANPGGVPIFPWMRSNISGEFTYSISYMIPVQYIGLSILSVLF